MSRSKAASLPHPSVFPDESSATGLSAIDGPIAPDSFTVSAGAESIYRIDRTRRYDGSLATPGVPVTFPDEDFAVSRQAETGSRPQRMIVFKGGPTPRQRFRSLQGWEGVVEDVSDRTFTARLFDLSRSGLEEVAEFEVAEVFEDDLSLLEPGAVFYWDVGYLETPGGRRRASEIRFRRLPAWTQEELDAAKKEAAEFRELVGWK
jgi:hypothetical protein